MDPALCNLSLPLEVLKYPRLEKKLYFWSRGCFLSVQLNRDEFIVSNTATKVVILGLGRVAISLLFGRSLCWLDGVGVSTQV